MTRADSHAASAKSLLSSLAVTALPIDEVLGDVVAHLRHEANLVLVAPPGAGKTTRLPQALIDRRVVADGQRVLVLEPRRLAARLAAKRIAAERGVKLGGEVGYQVRFDDRTSKASRIVLVTEGILTRRLQTDPSLDGVGAVILDEFHERSIHADLGLALLREVQQTIRDDLKIVVMSATLDPAPVQRFLGDCPVVQSQGRAYPVAVEYLARPDARSSADRTVSLVRKALRAHDRGDVLAFLPGAGEIRRAAASLEGAVSAEVCPLYGDLSPAAQDRAVAVGKGRKVVLATNIAESSLTIPGVSIVVDSGEQKIARHDPGLGVDRLELAKISQRSAEQRAGRAGRTGPGFAYRAWTEAAHKLLSVDDQPEILRIDLAGVLVEVLTWSSSDPAAFGWYEPPTEAQLRRAVALLRSLGALAPEGFRLTDRGRKLARLPLHPRLSALLVTGAERGLLDDAALLAALVSEKDIRRRDRPPEEVASSDLLLRAEAVRAYEADPRGHAADAYDLVRASVGQVIKVKERLVHLGRSLASDADRPSSESDLLRLVLAGFPDRVARRLSDDRYTVVGGTTARLSKDSAVHGAELLVAVSVDAGRRGSSAGGFIRWASQIEEAWLRTDTTGVREMSGARWNRNRHAAEATHEVRYLDLVLRRRSANNADPNALSACLAEAAALDLDRALPLTDAVMTFFARVRFLRDAMPELALAPLGPDDRAALVEALSIGRRSFDELRAVDLVQAFEQRLTRPQSSALSKHAPPALKVPSGSTKRLRYDAEGPPVLAVRLQEVFGLYESPRLADGRVPVKMELLAPNQRPVQVTQDLASFWAHTYAEVRKELRQRYPKHQWPEDPRDGVASARTMRRRKKT